MAAAVVALSLLPTDKLAAATVALGSIIGMMSLMILASQKVGAQKGNMSGLVTMTVMLGLVGTVIYTLAQLPWQQSVGAAAGISVVMLSLVASMNLLKMGGKVGASALASIVLMAGVMAAVAGILYLLRDMDVQSAIGNATALSTVLLAISASILILSKAKGISPNAVLAVGEFVLILGAVAGIFAVVGGLVALIPGAQQFLENGIPILTTIGEALGSFFGGIVKGFSVEATSGLPQIGQNLADFANSLSDINKGALQGAKNVAQIMLLITGAEFLDGFSKFLSNGLFGKQDPTDWGSKLSTFGKAVKGFSDSVSGIDEGAVTAAANCGKVLVELENALPRTGGALQKLIGEKLDLGTFGGNIRGFAYSIVAFSNIVKGCVDESAVTAAANCGKVLAKLNDALPNTGGILQKLTGEKDLETFGNRIKAFGSAIVDFSSTVSGDGKIDPTAIEAAKNAGQIMAELNNNLPTSDGALQWLLGQKDLSEWGEKLKSFGSSIVAFSQSVSGDNKIDTQAVEAVKNAGDLLVELSNALPETGLFDDQMSLSAFGTNLTSFGTAMFSFCGTVSGIDTSGVSTIVSAANSLIELSQSAANVNDDGITKINNVKHIGTAMSQYSHEVKGIKVEKVQTSVSAAKTLLNIITSLVGVDYSGIDGFNKVSDIGGIMSDYSSSVSGVTPDLVSGSVSAAKQLLNFIKSTSGIDTSGVSSFASAVNTLSKTDFSGFASAFGKQSSTFSSVGGKLADALAKGFSGKKSALTSTAISTISAMTKAIRQNYSTFTSTGKALMTKFGNGMKGQKAFVAAIAVGVANKAKNEIRGKYSEFYSAGSYLVSGFAKGISANTYKATAKARAMAKAATKAAKEQLDINSPSKVFERLGKFIPAGLAVGIEKMSHVSSGSAKNMAQSAVETARTALSRMTDVLSSDMSNVPTITPVLDLSNVQSGMGTLGTMLNSANSIGLTANLNAISSMRAARRQNGNNGDVVSAIKSLGKDINNMDRNSYNIGGITYEQGSDVAEAIETLVRASIIGGRS